VAGNSTLWRFSDLGQFGSLQSLSKLKAPKHKRSKDSTPEVVAILRSLGGVLFENWLAVALVAF